VGCQGFWLTEETMLELYRQAWTGYSPTWLPRFSQEPTRACPRCARPMKPSLIEIVEVERCLAHGIWFDAGELERALSLEPLDPVPARRSVARVLVELLAALLTPNFRG
jgi:hypothetical protein